MARKPPRRESDIRAAGVVVFGPGRTVLLVHRPAYDDWSFPKGKLERGEHEVAAAVREVAEETGVHVRLGPRLEPQFYTVKGRSKRVDYWVGRPVGDHDVSGYRPNDEIDKVAWVPVEEAETWLTYDHDRSTLGQAERLRKKTRTVVVLRHAKARSRSAWRGDDRERPLLLTGRNQAQRLVPLLAAHDVRHLVSSPSTRCVETLEPYAHTTGWPLHTEARLAEGAASPSQVRSLVRDLVDDLFARPASAGGLVLCSHRPVLPTVFEALRLPAAELQTGEFVVAHLRRGRVVATDRVL